MCMFISALGFLACRASHLHRTWPPAWTGFHVSQCVFTTGPPALSGFPSTRAEASSIDRRPCLVDFCTGLLALWGFPVEQNMASGMDLPPSISECMYYRASRFVGLPLLHRPLAHLCRGGYTLNFESVKYVCLHVILGCWLSWVGGSVQWVSQATCGWGFPKPQTKVSCVLSTWAPLFTCGKNGHGAEDCRMGTPHLWMQPARSPLSERE